MQSVQGLPWVSAATPCQDLGFFPYESIETLCPFMKGSSSPVFDLANYFLTVLTDPTVLKLVGFSVSQACSCKVSFCFCKVAGKGLSECALKACFSERLVRPGYLLHIDNVSQFISE